MKHYISTRTAETRPASLGGYDIIAAHRWRRIAGRKLFSIKPDEWQGIIDDEAALWASKTLYNAWGLLKEAAGAVGYTMPPVNLPKKRRAKKKSCSLSRSRYPCLYRQSRTQNTPSAHC